MKTTNWGATLVDMTIIIVAGYTGCWSLLFLMIITGGYTIED